ncbi:helix-turn-helix transcriptional regulator [Streptomyces sp. NPDC047525]|uniref:helix-turn-helix domain-containing protein n=1 Tax=Streptomyces sp. NPDC047525 TaxID=3155264 RepID=UPI0033D23983
MVLEIHLSIGERIAFYRKRRGYTQEVLAGLVGRSTDWLAKAETGRRKPPRIDMLAELARILCQGPWLTRSRPT